MKYYLQINEHNIITDAITYPFGNYIEYESDFPLPVGVYGGWFKFENGKIVPYPELKPDAPLELDVKELKERLALAESVINMLLLGQEVNTNE